MLTLQLQAALTQSNSRSGQKSLDCNPPATTAQLAGEKETKAGASRLSVLQREGVSESAHAELLAGAFTVLRSEDRGVHVHGATLPHKVTWQIQRGKQLEHLLLKKFVHGSGQAAANASDGADCVGARADMGEVAQMLKRQATF